MESTGCVKKTEAIPNLGKTDALLLLYVYNII